MKTVAFAGSRLFMKFGGLDYFRARAEEHDLEIIEARGEDEGQFIEQVKNVHAIVLIGRPVTEAVISALTHCELIQTLSVGYDSVDVEAATAAGIPVCNTPAYCTDEVASHAMTLLVTIARKIPTIIPETARGVWDYNFTRPIFSFTGRTIGIIGLGRVGRAVVPKARGFGMNVVAYDPYLDDDVFECFGVKRCYELTDLLEQADYVTIHAPLTGETRAMLGAPEFDRMKESAFIVNTARGAIWDEEAVAAAVSGGAIAGAATDVMVREPPDRGHPFFDLPGMVVTPHIAWYSEQSHRRNVADGMDEIVRVLSGRRPRSIVNPEVLSRR